jgi:hypothetical protein
MDGPGIFALGPVSGPDFQIGIDGEQIGAPAVGLDGMAGVTISARLAYGSGGSSLVVRIRTSIDQGVTWIDVCRFDFTTASALQAANLTGEASVAPFAVVPLGAPGIINGILGDRLMADVVSTGSYAGSTVLSVRIAVR